MTIMRFILNQFTNMATILPIWRYGFRSIFYTRRLLIERIKLAPHLLQRREDEYTEQGMLKEAKILREYKERLTNISTLLNEWEQRQLDLVSPSKAKGIVPSRPERQMHKASGKLVLNMLTAIMVVGMFVGGVMLYPELSSIGAKLGILMPAAETAGPVEAAIPILFQPPANGFLLEDFEKGYLGGWLAAGQQFGPREIATRVQLSSDAANGKGALQCDFNFDLLPALENPKATCYFDRLPIEDWSEYDTMLFQAKSLVDPGVKIQVYLSLATGQSSCWNELGVFYTLSPEYQTFTFDLDDPLYATCEDLEENYDQTLTDKNYVRRLHLIFEADQRMAGSVLVDNIWLAKMKP